MRTKRLEKKIDSDRIRTCATEVNTTLTCRLRPLGHTVLIPNINDFN